MTMIYVPDVSQSIDVVGHGYPLVLRHGGARFGREQSSPVNTKTIAATSPTTTTLVVTWGQDAGSSSSSVQKHSA